MIRFAWLAVVVMAGCIQSNSVTCSDGSICPSGTICDPDGLCVTEDQLAACQGKGSGDACMYVGTSGFCVDGVCLPQVCGDGVIEPGEQCDDGNTVDRDGCSADCKSIEICGNHVVDLLFGERCDDGNHLDHDGCSSSCQDETPRWLEHSLSPPARLNAMYAYDVARDRLVMFGGSDVSGTPLNDTWEWNGADWVHIPTASAPEARTSGAMAYDAAHKVVVLYGGFAVSASTGFSDTWLWNGSTWRLAEVPLTPGARAQQSMAYDHKRMRVVLFGGARGNGTLGDTWEWDGLAWTQVTTASAPVKRKAAAMSYDPVRSVIVLTGGQDSVFTNDTWEYDGTDWKMKGTSPGAFMSGLTWDKANARTLLYNGGAVSAWNPSTTTWTTVTFVGTPARPGAVFAQVDRAIVLFGGSNGPAVNETWLLANATWTNVQLVQPTSRATGMFVNDPLRARLLLYGGETALNTRTAETWELSTNGYTRLGTTTPTARSASCIAYDRAHNNIVLFGGATGAGSSTPIAETWIWDGSTWNQKSPPTSPPPRMNAACAFDGHQVTLFGGFNASFQELGDAWTWTGTTWSPVAVPAALTARASAAAAYDPVHDVMVMFGGQAIVAMTSYDETWTYDGTTWTQVNTTGLRPPILSSAMAWNPARKSMILTSGVAQLDSYEWDGTTWHPVAATNLPPGRNRHVAASAIEGGGVFIYGGFNSSANATFNDRWELRWDSTDSSERCNIKDGDNDSLIACLDPDCWWVCAPLCPPNTTCDPIAPKCGDGICDGPREGCHSCPADCTCSPVCGDGFCDPGETCPGDC